MTDDDDFFLREMQGVKKIQQTKKVDLSKPHSITEAQKLRQQSATQEKISSDPNHLQHYEVERVQPHDEIGFKCHGIQDGVFRKLRQGKFPIDARLDLHRMTIDKAREVVFGFINDCVKYDLRTILITPGKGDRNMEDPALLKSYLVHWLPQLADVMAYHTAQPNDGGAGAFYVILRKNSHNKDTVR
ncbi:MAG: DNA-nicking Smr family endonuclease [Oleispira sp.]|jgi:DNA-nicking Smr family endonuclease